MLTGLRASLPLAIGAVLVPAVLFAAALPDTRPEPNEVETVSMQGGPMWTHVGCIQLGADCFDVFEDKRGNLWVCEECFTTQNPNPGKCRRLTPVEIATAVFCA